MDLDIIQSTKEGEITQFLCDVRDYFKASLATSEYENTSNMFYLTAAETTEQLLNRCECLLNRLKNKHPPMPPINTKIDDSYAFSPMQPTPTRNQRTGIRDKSIADVKNQWSINIQGHKNEIINDDVSYLDMSATHLENLDNDKKQSSLDKIVDINRSGDSDKTFRCSTFVVRQNKSFLHRLHDTLTTVLDDETNVCELTKENQGNETNSFKEDAQIYDICQVATQGSDVEEDELGLEETVKAINQDSHLQLSNMDCPYSDLPAGHLAIQKSIKYGQLLKIEKRLFFDQSKKCYCGILNDWLLCYADGPTSNRPTISIYLKIPGIEIEHFGEGKRRDISFQITTCDLSKRFVFQAVNEIDAKEWIHAIEAAIRSDATVTDARNSSTRKLPTPPVMKKITFLNPMRGGSGTMFKTTSNDCIYEEPSPIQQVVEKSRPEKQPELPDKQKHSLEKAQNFEYDVPKCPPQPFKDPSENDVLILINPYENNKTKSPEKSNTISLPESLNLGSSPPSAQKLNLKIEENLDFQAKVKDVHNKLTSQLSSSPLIKKPLKKSLSAATQNDTELLSLPLQSESSPETTDFKKHKKTSNPSNSPQRVANARNWFLNRLNKTTSSTKSNSTSPSNSPSKCKQSEKENLLNFSSDVCDGYDTNVSNLVHSPVSTLSKSSSTSNATSKVNRIINQLEASGHLASMFNVDSIASFSSFCDNDSNNYEPIMTVSTSPVHHMKNV